MTHTAKRTGEGQYEYRGYNAYRTSDRRDAYNPWKISLLRGSYPTLKAVKAEIDRRLEAYRPGETVILPTGTGPATVTVIESGPSGVVVEDEWGVRRAVEASSLRRPTSLRYSC